MLARRELAYRVAAVLILAISATNARASSIVEYAKCSGILVLAAALTKSDDPEHSKIYLEDASALETKASKLKGFNRGTFMEIAFDQEGDYMEMLKKNAASTTDFWSDAGYCRGLAQ